MSNVDLSRRRLLADDLARPRRRALLPADARPISGPRSSSSGRPGSLARAEVPGRVRQVRPVHAGLPDGRAPAGARPRPGPRGSARRMLVPQDRLLRVLLLALHAGLPDRGHPKLDRRGEEQGQDRASAWVNKSRCIPYVLRQALHRLRGALPGLAQGHQARRGRDRSSPDGTVARPEGPGRRHRALHGLRHLREQVPGHGPTRPSSSPASGRRGLATNRLLLDITGGTAEDPYK
ncbi:MAG: hypothetical protein MZU95_12875 [Desulfomicrobium escambiense]|nr:hypothetical protein [Desulfomicrobium escambiense]